MVEMQALVKNSVRELVSKGTVSKLDLKQNGILRCNSQSADYLTKDHVYHRLGDWVNSGEVILEKVDTNMLTKPVTSGKFRHCLNLLKLTSC